ncbi:hypothetical protein GCK32_022894 [Trichostrongylus colubriformis]|uniref:DUF1758 domain-containing protein n=1 Tax=Trichostrongylus colubriformis TaxID=6319 RepID=A0AAN8IK69_TRICO
MSSETQSSAEKLISTSISQSAPTKTETPINDSPLITLMCATVTLFNPSEPSRQMEVTAFLDSGSNKSYITQHVAATLQLSTLAEEEINVCTFATEDSLQLQCEYHYIGIYTEKGARQLDVRSVPILTRALYRAQPAQSGDSNSITTTTCEPSILIGNDYFWDMVLSENFYYKVLSNGYHFLPTTIGDIVVNKVLDVKTAITYTSFNEGVANPSHHEDLAELVSKFWKLEAVGIIDDPNQNDDEECLNLFNNSILYNDDERRYTVSLSFKTNPSQLPDNYGLAYSRPCSQLRTLQQNPLYLEKYNTVIVDQLERGIIEEIPQTT